ncbi:MAG: VWA domain-containing protein [Planctomycetota bacterium]|nr:MAG: VWA domain-containing protein [Planctomycetota bacterium]
MLVCALLLAQQGFGPPLQIEPPRTEALLQVLADDTASAQLRAEALADLAAGDGPLPLEPLLALRNLAHGPALADYARCLGRSEPGALPVLRKIADKDDAQARAEAVYAIAHLDADGGVAFARSVLAGTLQPDMARVAALRALADLESPFARVEALRALERAEGPLLMEALAVLRRHPDLEDAPYLVRVLDRCSGRPGRETVALLQELTGYRVGLDARTWEYFLLKHKAEGTPFRRDAAAVEAETETLSYFGIPIRSDRVVFVLDSSGSMNDLLPEQPRHTRGSMAVEELIRTLPRLEPQARFNIVFFSERAAAFGPAPSGRDGGLSPRTEEQLTAATGWLRNRRFDGGTNILAALELAFEHPGVEEVILLSDGEPTVGEVRPYRILNQVARWNRWRHVRVSTIALAAPLGARQFLYKLAAQHDGACRVLE